MQRPLYGLAVDLTPEAVIGPAPLRPAPVAANGAPTVQVQGAPSPNAAPAPTQQLQGAVRPSSARLVAAAVAVGAMAWTILMAASRSDPPPATAAQTASVGKAVAASQAPIPVVAPRVAKAPAQASKSAAANKASAAIAARRPADPFESRAEPPDADLAATLERLREGIK